jgi:hypothetical protein
LPALGRPRMQTKPEWKDMRLGDRLQAFGIWAVMAGAQCPKPNA